MPDKIQVQKVICEGGLDTTENHLLLNEQAPGAATRLVNYEVAPSGGYRRINGYSKFDDDYYNIDDTNAEGKILGLCIYHAIDGTHEYFAARKQKSGATYKWYEYTSGVGWTAVTTGITHNTTSGGNTVNRIRHHQVNFGSSEVVCFVDGVNKAVLYDGTTWAEIDSAGTGADVANAGGANALDAPSLVTSYKNHLFVGRTSATKAIVAHSAPNATYDWTTANGAGQITTGFDVVQIKAFRDILYVFGEDSIKNITVDNTGAFVLNNTTGDIGCVAADSVQEVGGNLIFLANDGFRPIAGTDRIGDVEISLLSDTIRDSINNIIGTASLDVVNTFHGVVLRTKSQVRFFYGGETDNGIIGGVRYGRQQGATRWEFGQLYGFSPSVMTSAIVNGMEVVLHGDFNGNIYQQESGNSFDGGDILSIYAPPFLDQGYPDYRKTYEKMKIFLKPGGAGTMYINVKYDWQDSDMILPGQYELTIPTPPVVYGGFGVTYGGTGVVYGGGGRPVVYQNFQGSAYSIRPSFVTIGTDAPHIIQGFTLQFIPEGLL